ncbi:MAG: S4 domain-containing protein [Sphingomicrobium sp.]
MRIDRFLHCIRLARSRTFAQSIVAAGHVRIDGRRVLKPHDDVCPGAIVALPLNNQVRVLRVVALPYRRGPVAEARTCYQEVGVDEAAARS